MSPEHEHDHGHAEGRPHAHSHGPSLARAGARHVRPLAIAFGLIAAFFVVEAIAGVITNSLALLSDAGHMLTDVVGLGMALAAIQLASRYERTDGPGRGGTPSQHTFGLYRLEILAAFVNALLLFAVAIYVLVEAVRRLFDETEVLGVPMLIVASLGLVVNLIAFGWKRTINGTRSSLPLSTLSIAARSSRPIGRVDGEPITSTASKRVRPTTECFSDWRTMSSTLSSR
jgi:Co/Zn/Cd efflux system component